MAGYAGQGGGGKYGYLEIGELLNGRIARLNEEEYWQTTILAREFEEYCKHKNLDLQDLKGLYY